MKEYFWFRVDFSVIEHVGVFSRSTSLPSGYQVDGLPLARRTENIGNNRKWGHVLVVELFGKCVYALGRARASAHQTGATKHQHSPHTPHTISHDS